VFDGLAGHRAVMASGPTPPVTPAAPAALTAELPLSRLKARALMLLAQREQSEAELRRKLLHQAQLLRSAKPVASAARSSGAGQASGRTAADQALLYEVSEARDPDIDQALASTDQALELAIDQTLLWLKSQGHLSESRFVESRVHTRAGRYGNQRIRQELAQHGLVLPEPVAQALHDSEFERAAAVWRRKFQSGKPMGRLTADATEAGGDDPLADEPLGPQATRLAARDAARQQAAMWAKQARFLSSRGFSAEVVQRVIRQARETGEVGAVDGADGPG
jgi:regulatory protein